MTCSLRAKIGYVFARGAFAQLRERMDPRRANGGVFLGLNGIVIKSHGGADAEGYAAAIEVGHGVVRDELLAKIRAALERHGRSQDGRSQDGRSQNGASQPGAGQILEGDVRESKAVGGAAS
jgi:glycerol-3-phosphate acyltransferase PlsX